MLKYIPIFILCLCLTNNSCFSDRYIVPSKHDYQEEILIQGASVLHSNKLNSVSIYQTCETIQKRRANFYFLLSNNTNSPLNFCVSNLKVTDQYGRPIKLMSKQELLDAKKSQRNWQIFASALCSGLEAINAQNAGRIDYQSHSQNTFNSNYSTYGSSGWSRGSMNEYSTSTTYGTVHCEALRQQALRDAENKAIHRNNSILGTYETWEYGLNHFYFDSTTIFPNTVYAANIQIEVPPHIEKDLQFLVFSFDIENDPHTFYFYCGKEEKKWYHFWY